MMTNPFEPWIRQFLEQQLSRRLQWAVNMTTQTHLAFCTEVSYWPWTSSGKSHADEGCSWQLI